jgi:hypothetical protein
MYVKQTALNHFLVERIYISFLCSFYLVFLICGIVLASIPEHNGMLAKWQYKCPPLLWLDSCNIQLPAYNLTSVTCENASSLTLPRFHQFFTCSRAPVVTLERTIGRIKHSLACCLSLDLTHSIIALHSKGPITWSIFNPRVELSPVYRVENVVM